MHATKHQSEELQMRMKEEKSSLIERFVIIIIYISENWSFNFLLLILTSLPAME